MGRPSDAARPDDTRERNMSTEKRLGSAVIARLFETNDAMLDAPEIFELAQAMVMRP